jgi:hypothetical protein
MLGAASRFPHWVRSANPAIGRILKDALTNLKMKQPSPDWKQIIEGSVYFHALANFNRL